ncbi:N-acetylmuramoyl-L-alanine amidase [Holdemanella porci]|uniref:N-acetylmuramoyl-L-alanine amidase n=1 Tax=Holdemanella porci TaxID=2652276 RepID=UPI0022E74266|nr:N-acetylmuramoyl-L-alanine amidase [Holdemanella porci]
MSKRFKPILALVLSLFMFVSTLSNTYTVFAEDETAVQTDEQTSEDTSTEEGTQVEVNQEEDTTSNPVSEEEQLGDSSMMEYFLVDNPTLTSGSAEHFVLSMNDANGYSDFSITVQKTDGTTFDLEASEQVDKLVKFTKDFSSADKGEYSVTTLHYTYNGEKYYLNFSNLGMDVKFGVDQEYSGYDETLPDMTQDIVVDDELNSAVVQVTSLDDASEEVAEGIMASNPEAVMALVDENSDIATQANEGVTICLDPGHGGNDSGAIGINNVYEKNLTLKIAQYCKQELEKYNCHVVMTRTGDTNPSLVDRANFAKSQGAQYLISIHLNSAAGGGAVGAEVYYPNTHWRPDISQNGKNVAQAIQNQLMSLGIRDRGIKFRTIDTKEYPDPYRYDDGSVADYYGIIRNAKYNGLTGMIIEHCFINNVSDYNNYLNSDAKLQKLGVADANGIVSALGLTKASENSVVSSSPSISYQTHVQDYGWQSWKSNGEVSGTVGQSKRLEGINIKLSNINGSIEYKTHVQDIGWQDWKSNGQMSGTSGQSKRLEAIKVKLSGEAANQYDVYYRVHAQDYGWLDWAKNGESAGTEGYSKRLEGIQIVLVKKGENAPGSTSRPFIYKMIKYQTHVQNIGWQGEKADGEMSGTTGQSLRLEAIKIQLSSSIDGGIVYKTHVQDYGWLNFVTNGQASGTTGQAKRLEAIQMQLTGNAMNQYDLYYRVHAQNFGWLGWAKNGESAGTAGYSYRLEGIQIVLVPKGGNAPGSTSKHYYNKGYAPDDENVYLPIMGSTQTSVDQMVRYYNANASGYDTFKSKYDGKYDGSLAKGGASTINQFAHIVYEEAIAEGVKPEVVFTQCMKETAFLKYGGEVNPNQYNFAGIGATGSVHGATFENVRMGIRAQVQHLKAYGSLDKLINQCVDPRFNLVSRGSAKYVEWLGKKENPTGAGWATSKNYGHDIVNMINVLLNK